jgi:preprotein translocase SecE subunit
MALELYKKGQGTVARASAYAIGALLIGFGALRLFAAVNVPGAGILTPELPLIGALTISKVVAFAVGVAGVLGLHYVLNRPKSVDLLIETEAEMRRVSWPTMKQVWNATLVVAFVSMLLAVTMSGLDLVIRQVLHLIF